LPRFAPEDIGAAVATAADLDQPRLLESAESLADGDPADPQLFSQLPLGGEPLAQRDDAQLDRLAEPGDGLLEQVARPNRAKNELGRKPMNVLGRNVRRLGELF
jgi:hypothetical protein